jgi:hypothetical protein
MIDLEDGDDFGSRCECERFRHIPLSRDGVIKRLETFGSVDA